MLQGCKGRREGERAGGGIFPGGCNTPGTAGGANLSSVKDGYIFGQALPPSSSKLVQMDGYKTALRLKEEPRGLSAPGAISIKERE